MSVDEKDRRILTELARDARQSVRTIARRTGIRPSTVHQRISRLVRGGLIEGFTVRIRDEAFGARITVFMLVSGTADRYLDSELLKDPRVQEVHAVTGEYDVLLKLRFRDLDEFSAFVIGFRERFHRAVVKTVTMVATARLDDPRRPLVLPPVESAAPAPRARAK